MPDCGRKVENQDLGLCATHNKARRVSERPVAPVKVYQWKRSGPIAPVSAGQSAKLREEKKAYAVVDEGPRHCVSCGGTDMLTHSHVLPKGNFEQHRANPENILLECQECHMVWEHNKHTARRLHASWNQKLAIILKLEPGYYTLFISEFGGPV